MNIKKGKGVNSNVTATITYNEYKDLLLNIKCIRHSISRIQSKDHRIGTYEIKKNSLCSFDDKIYPKHRGEGHFPPLLHTHIHRHTHTHTHTHKPNKVQKFQF